MEPVSYIVHQIRGNKIVEYEQVDFIRSAKQVEFIDSLNSNKLTYQGEMSRAGRAKMARAMRCWWTAMAEFNDAKNGISPIHPKKMVFITLTLPTVQIHGDKDIKHYCLRPFMRYLFDNHGVTNYIWKAEIQKNGNLHFHIVIDQFVDKEIISSTWNDCLEKLGYISAFEAKHGHRVPPSTQIQAARNQHDVESYIGKYIGKEIGVRPIEGRVWQCSKSLSQLKYFSYERGNYEDAMLRNGCIANEITMKSYEKSNVYFLGKQDLKSYISQSTLEKYEYYCSILCMFLYANTLSTDYYTFVELVTPIERVHELLPSTHFRQKILHNGVMQCKILFGDFSPAVPSVLASL